MEQSSRSNFRISFFSLLLLIPFLLFATGPSPQLLQKIKTGEVSLPAFMKDYQANGSAESQMTQIGPINPQIRGFSGNFKALAILIDFPDQPALTDSSTYDSLLYGNQLGNLKNYWSEASYGNFTLTTVNMPSTLGWFTAADSLMYYVGTKNGLGSYPNNAQKLAEEAILAADPYVNFADYDNDGDGKVDLVFIIHAGSGAEYTGSASDIVSHHNSLKTALSLDGVSVTDYTMEPEYWVNPGDMTIGVFAREMAEYLFNLPVLWDWDKEAGGLGDWSLMATGNWNGPNGLGKYPALPDAWSRWQLGYLTPTTLLTDTSLTIPAVEDSAVAYRVWTNGIMGAQYFLLENRQQTGYDAYLPGSGLLIYHVDESVSSTPLNRYPWYPGNTNNGHYYIALEQADGNWDLELARDNGNAGDPFPGSTNNSTFNATSSPGSKNYADMDTYVSITNINESSGNITANIQLSHLFNWTGNALVWDADDTPLSGPIFKTFLQDSGFVVDYTPEILLVNPDSLQRYKYIFISLGMYPNNHIVQANEAALLQAFLNLPNKKVYMEGGNTFRQDPQTAFHQMFNIGGFNKAKRDLYTVKGVQGTFMDSLEFVYSGENNTVDRLAPENGSIAIFENPDIPYFISVAYDGNTYKTIGSSFEFGGLVDGAPPSTQAEAFSLIMKYFNDKLPKPAPRDLVAGSGLNGMVPLTWDPPAGTTTSRASRADTLVSYRVYRSTVSGGPYTMIADVDVSGRTYNDHEDYIDTTVLNDTTYYYVLTAFYSDTTESPYSDEVTATPAPDSVMTKQLSYSGWIPTLDGVITDAEWGDAVKIPIQAVSTLDSIFLYMKSDETHLYIAVDDPNNTHDADDNNLDIWFDDDFNHTWDPTINTTEGAFLISYKNSDSIKVRFHPTYGSYPNNINFNTNELWPAGVNANASLTSGHMQWEVSIDLQNSYLTAAQGDTVGLFVTEYDGYTYIDHYYNDSGDWPYGAIYVAPQTFGPVVIGIKPPIPEIAVNPAAISEFVVGDTSLVDTLWIKNTGLLKLGFSITDSSAGWLSEAPLADSVAAGDSLPVQVTMNGLGLAAGVYNGLIRIASNDPFDSLVTVPVQISKVSAFIRSASLDKSFYKSGETINVSEEIDSYLTSQVVRVNTELLDSLNNQILLQTRVLTLLGTSDDGFVESLLIPDTTASGNYAVKITVVDTVSGIIQDTLRLPLEIKRFDKWQVVVLVQNDTLQMNRVFGGNQNGTDGFDTALDVLTAAPGTEFYSYFYISQIPNYLATDIRNWVSPFDAPISWQLDVVNTNGGNFSMSWDPDSLPPVGNFTLTWNGQNYDMRTTTTVNLSGDGSASISYSRATDFTYTFNNAGWYLVSIPVTPADNSLSTLFPDALIAYVWNNATGNYEAVTQLETGKGYWLAFAAASSNTISGDPVNSFSGHYLAGWHMIGSLISTTDFSSPNDTPDGSIAATYGYNNATGQYYATTTLTPGEGYWIAALQECDLTVPGARSTSAPEFTSDEMAQRWEAFTSKFGSTPPPPPTATSIGPNGHVVKKFTLFQNYPNPFNPVTKISFYVDQPGKVNLEIFNILGQRVKVLVNGERNVGLYEINWDATNDVGHKVPSGIYFYRLKAGQKTAIRKMMLLK